MRDRARFALGALGVLLVSGVALAQGRNQSAPAASAASDAPTSSAAPSATTPPRPMAGYSYSDPKSPKGQGQQQGQQAAPQKPPPTPRVAKATPKVVTGPIATLPGFEILGDGSSRVFVQLTQNVPVEERKAKGSVTYVLKGAHVAIHNNTNPLVTVHFNTPVTKAQLRPSGADLLLVIDLRAASTPAWKITAAKDGTAILQIDFAKGAFIPGGGTADDDAPKGGAKPPPVAKGKS
jgi:hypothetical protein